VISSLAISAWTATSDRVYRKVDVSKTVAGELREEC